MTAALLTAGAVLQVPSLHDLGLDLATAFSLLDAVARTAVVLTYLFVAICLLGAICAAAGWRTATVAFAMTSAALWVATNAFWLTSLLKQGYYSVIDALRADLLGIVDGGTLEGSSFQLSVFIAGFPALVCVGVAIAVAGRTYAPAAASKVAQRSPRGKAPHMGNVHAEEIMSDDIPRENEAPDFSWDQAGPPEDVAPVRETMVLSVGDIGVSQHWITTPNGSAGLSGSMWIVSDQTTTQSKIPTWAIVCAIVFSLACLLGLFFLLIREQVITGYVQVTVRSEVWSHSTQISVSSPQGISNVRQLVSQAQSMAAVA